MKKIFTIITAIILSSPNIYAQDATDQKFHHLFKTAGYATAFGAALGAAALSFRDHPNQDLKYVAIGASVGFIGGSILGSYVILRPIINQGSQQETPRLHQSKLGILGEVTIARF